jgi:glycosyltransferase involved in cell wall biosynthesis
MLSVVIPVYNEGTTLKELVANVQATPLEHELVLVDDASTDGTHAVLEELSSAPNIRIFRHPVNRGKGAAIRTGFEQARGDVVLVQDADLEYDPGDYGKLVEPIESGSADVVYGSRFMPGADSEISRLTFVANNVITWFFNLVLGTELTDVETCYKAFRRDLLEKIAPQLVEERFGIEIELTARVAKTQGARIVERPIRYRARTRKAGKKIGWKDGVRALWCIWRYR